MGHMVHFSYFSDGCYFKNNLQNKKIEIKFPYDTAIQKHSAERYQHSYVQCTTIHKPSAQEVVSK